MRQVYKRWTLGLLSGILVLCTLCAALVYVADPGFYYHGVGNTFQPVFFNERLQTAGLAKNIHADTVLMGTSMVANYRYSHAQEAFGGTAVKLTLPDGYLSEFDAVMQVVWRNYNPKRVVFGLDANILIRDESGKTDAMPDYLYDANPLNDVQYLLNKDTLYYSFFRVMSQRWGTKASLDDAYTWDANQWWNHTTALNNYPRPEIAQQAVPQDAYLENARANLAVVENWAKEHPDTEFCIFFPPYSILHWDKVQRTKTTDAVFVALEEAAKRLTAFENIKLYSFLSEEDIVTNLDNYCDHVHHSGQVCDLVLNRIAADENRLTAENYEQTLVNWREFVINYPYEQFWDESFWTQWNQQEEKGI